MRRIIASMLAPAALAATLLAASPVLADDAGNEALAKRFYTELAAGNLDAYDEFIAADIINHSAPPDAKQGLEAVKQGIAELRRGFSDITITNEKVLVSGDHVTVVSRCRGTNTGPLFGEAPTGKPVDFQTIDVWLVKDGKLSEVWHVEQFLQMLTQLGRVGENKA